MTAQTTMPRSQPHGRPLIKQLVFQRSSLISPHSLPRRRNDRADCAVFFFARPSLLARTSGPPRFLFFCLGVTPPITHISQRTRDVKRNQSRMACPFVWCPRPRRLNEKNAGRTKLTNFWSTMRSCIRWEYIPQKAIITTFTSPRILARLGGSRAQALHRL